MTYQEIIAFHGHQCPGLAMGFRMATAAMDHLASILSEDEELVAIVENDACGIDALQCVTGCTFGKGNLIFRDYGKHVYTIYCRTTRNGVRVHFHGRGAPEEIRENRDAMAQWILSATEEEILAVQPVSIPEPEPARIRDSLPCQFCGESVMASRIRRYHDKPACIPCFQVQQKDE